MVSTKFEKKDHLKTRGPIQFENFSFSSTEVVYEGYWKLKKEINFFSVSLSCDIMVQAKAFFMGFWF